MAKRRFVILDRDGTLIVERHYLTNPEGVELVPGAAKALRHLREQGLGLVVVTNQSAVGRRLLDPSRLEAIHDRLLFLLRQEGVDLDGIYVCPHTPEDGCECRKPKTSLLEQAARELNFESQSSFVIGDSLCDVELGRHAGAVTFLVLTGYGRQVSQEHGDIADYTVSSLEAATTIILRLLGLESGAGAAQGRMAPEKGA